MMFNINPTPPPPQKKIYGGFPLTQNHHRFITTTVQGSKIKAKSIEMAPVIGKVLVESTRGTSWVDGCWEQKTCQKPMRMICFRTSHPHNRRLLQLAGCFLVDMPLPKTNICFIFWNFYPISDLPGFLLNQNLHPQINYKTPPPKRKLLIRTSSSSPPRFFPPKKKTLDDVFKPLSHRGWTIWPSSIRYYNSAKTTTPQRGGSRSAPPSTVVLESVLLNLIGQFGGWDYSRHIPKFMPLWCGIPLVDFASLPAFEYFPIKNIAFTVFPLYLHASSSRETFLFKLLELSEGYRFTCCSLHFKGVPGSCLLLCPKCNWQRRFFPEEKFALPLSWCSEKKGLNTFISRFTGGLILPTQTLHFDNENPSTLPATFASSLIPPQKNGYFNDPHHITMGT